MGRWGREGTMLISRGSRMKVEEVDAKAKEIVVCSRITLPVLFSDLSQTKRTNERAKLQKNQSQIN